MLVSGRVDALDRKSSHTADVREMAWRCLEWAIRDGIATVAGRGKKVKQWFLIIPTNFPVRDNFFE